MTLETTLENRYLADLTSLSMSDKVTLAKGECKQGS